MYYEYRVPQVSHPCFSIHTSVVTHDRDIVTNNGGTQPCPGILQDRAVKKQRVCSGRDIFPLVSRVVVALRDGKIVLRACTGAGFTRGVVANKMRRVLHLKR